MKKLNLTPDLLTGRLSEFDAKRFFSAFGWFAFIFYAVRSLVANSVGLAVYYFLPNIYNNVLFWNVSSFATYAIALPVAYIFLRPMPVESLDSVNMSRPDVAKGFCICLVLMTAGSYISSFVMTAVEIVFGSAPENPVEQAVSEEPWWVTLIFVVIIAPIVEELVFRKLVCRRLLVMGEGYAIVLSAAFFALCHGNFYQLFYAFGLGLFFAFIYVKTGKLIYSVLYHVGINFIGGIVAPFVSELVDIDTLLEGEFVINSSNILGLIALFWYEMLMTVAMVIGLFFAIKNIRAFKLARGLVELPEGRRATCIFFNTGIIAAIALFGVSLVSSLLY